MAIILLILGFILVIKGADLLVTGGSSLARKLHVSDLVIGLTVVAFGTSIPELATSVVAAFRKNPDIAVGNVVGSNIFNIFFILGLSTIVRPLLIQSSDTVHIVAALVGSAILFLCMFTGKRKILDRWEGALLILGYLAYLYLVVAWG